MNLRVVDTPTPASKPAKPASIGHAGERNPGYPLDLDWVGRVRMNRSALERRAATIGTRRTVKKEWQAAWLLRAITLMDLTTLNSDDTPGRVERLCAKARHPLTQDILDGWFGAGNWFCYPDRRSGIGVTKLPLMEDLPELIDYIDVDEKRYGQRRCPVSGIGAHVELRLPVAPDQTPEWQRAALERWRKEQERDREPLERERLNVLFGTNQWSRHRVMTFIVSVDLPAPLEVHYPVTSAEVLDKARYGVGQECPAGPARLSLAGDLPERYS